MPPINTNATQDAPTLKKESGFRFLLDLTREEKCELIKEWKQMQESNYFKAV